MLIIEDVRCIENFNEIQREMMEINKEVNRIEFMIEEAVSLASIFVAIKSVFVVISKILSFIIKIMSVPLAIVLVTKGPKLASSGYKMATNKEYASKVLKSADINSFRKLAASATDPVSFINGAYDEMIRIERKIVTASQPEKLYVTDKGKERIKSNIKDVEAEISDWFKKYAESQIMLKAKNDIMDETILDSISKCNFKVPAEYTIIEELENDENNITGNGISLNFIVEYLKEFKTFINDMLVNDIDRWNKYGDMNHTKNTEYIINSEAKRDTYADIYGKTISSITGETKKMIPKDLQSGWFDFNGKRFINKYKVDPKGILGMYEYKQYNICQYCEYLKGKIHGNIINEHYKFSERTRKVINTLFFDGEMGDSPDSSKKLRQRAEIAKRKIDNLAKDFNDKYNNGFVTSDKTINGVEPSDENELLRSYIECKLLFIKNHVLNLANSITNIYLHENIKKNKFESEVLSLHYHSMLDVFWSAVKNDIRKNYGDYSLTMDMADDLIKKI